MSKKFMLGALAPVFFLMLCASSVQAQSVSSQADNNNEYQAYVNTYIAMVQSGGLTNVIDSGVNGEVTQLVDDLVTDGFYHCYDAIMDDNDSLWLDAADDLELALYWTDTMLTFSQNSESSSTIQQIESLQWRLEIAIDYCKAAAPKRKMRRKIGSSLFGR